jgi:eukaryotic-like serine/threonine-protein kinase
MALPDLGQTGSLYSFLDLTLDVSAERLTRGETEVKLRPKSFQVLRYLAERSGRLVTRDELLEAIWPNVVVTDESITKCIADIRKALSDDSQQVIRTVARRGYVFTVPVTSIVEFPRPADPQSDPGHSAPMIHQDRQPRRIEAFPSAPRVTRPRWVWAALVVTLIASGVTVTLFRARPNRESVPAAQQYIQLTNFTDAAFSPALSPDGRMFTFIRGENPGTIGGPGDVFIKLLPDGEPVQLTHDGKRKLDPAFTPGGDRVSYSYSSLMTEPQNWTTWTVSVFGGEPKALLANASALTWIPGASPPRVLFSRVDNGIHMSIVTSTENATGSRTVYAPAVPNAMAHRSFLSPDRKHVLVVEMNTGWAPCRLVPFEAGEQTESPTGIGRKVGPSPGQCSSAAWSPDGRWMYLSVNTGSGYHIWRQRFPDGIPEQLTFGATEEAGVAVDPDGRSFLTSVGTRQSTLWIHDANGERQITHEGYASFPRFSPDGRRLYYLLRSQANRRYLSGELWSANLETGKRERLLPEFLVADYSVSTDGNRMLFVAIAEDGDTSVWLAPVDGRLAPRRLSDVHADRAFFGVDGEVLFSTTDEGTGRFLYRVSEDGSGIRKAIQDPINYAYDVSPDGELVAVWRGAGVQVVPIHGGPSITASMLCAAAGGEDRGTTPPCLSWSPDGKLLYVYDRTAFETYAVPIPPGRGIPSLPIGGIASAQQVARWSGAQVIKQRTAFPSGDPSIYAFFRVTSQRNIYRVRLPGE